MVSGCNIGINHSIMGASESWLHRVAKLRRDSYHSQKGYVFYILYRLVPKIPGAEEIKYIHKYYQVLP